MKAVFVAVSCMDHNPFENGVLPEASADIDKVRRAIENHVADPTWYWEAEPDTLYPQRIPGAPDRWYVSPDGDQGFMIQEVTIV